MVTGQPGTGCPVQERMEKMKNKKAKNVLTVLVAVYAVLATQAIVLASGNTAISGPLNNLRTIVTDLVTGIGAIVTLYGIFEFGNAQQSQDGAMKSFAIQRIAGGLIMVVAPQLLQLFVG